jgi:hypothetical protein
MTRMSEPHAVRSPRLQRKPLQSQARSRVAYGLHASGAPVVLAVVAMSMLASCVIPPSLEVGEDAGVNAPPAIVAVTSEQQALPEPGPVLFDKGRTAGTLTVSLLDVDVTDTLYVRIFVDYNQPDRLDARVRCPDSATSTATRTVTCNLTTLCTDTDIGVQRNMTIVVFDRKPLEDGSEPAFQAMPPGGLSTSRFYFLKCQPGQS